MLKAGSNVAAIASEVGVSEPTVYKAIVRLNLTLPSKSSRKGAAPVKAGIDSPAGAAAKTSKARAPKGAPTSSTPNTFPKRAVGTAKSGLKGHPARGSRSSSTSTASPPSAVNVDAGAAAGKAVKPGTGLVPIGSDADLLTVRVDKGIELLRNLSARIVRHERELAAARQRYAETLAALALS